MAQKVIQQYKDEIKSWEANERAFGPVSPGRVRGYDNVTEGATTGFAVHFILGHQSNRAWETPGIVGYSGIEKSDTANALESALGMAIMMNGSMVIEDGNVGEFEIDITQAAGERQRFWIIAEHTWTLLAGGSAVTYSVIAGAVTTGSTYTDPILTNAAKQVVIAEIDVPKTSEYARTFANLVAISRGPIQSFSNGRNAAQLIADAGLLSAADIATNYYTQAQVDAAIAAAKPYTNFVGNMSQSGTSNPSVEILENSMGTITWVRTGVGIYDGTLDTPASDVVFLWVNINTGDPGSAHFDILATADDTIRIRSLFNGTLTDALLDLISFEIRLYEP